MQFYRTHLLDSPEGAAYSAAMQAAANVKLTANRGPERLGDVRHSRADISVARDVLGFKPQVAFEEGVQRTLAWFRDQPK